MRRSAVRVAVFLAVICLIGALLFFVFKGRFGTGTAGYDDSVLAQYLWAPPGVPANPIEELLEKRDPLQAVWHAWRTWYYSKDADLASREIEKILTHWNVRETGKLTYGYPHGTIGAGWWSGMDMLMLPMLLVEVGKSRDSEEYLRVARKVLETAMKSPSDGGVLWPDKGAGCWLSEYSWEGITRDEEYYVLNGHLFALQALRMVAEQLDDEGLKEKYDCAARGVEALASRFMGSDGRWPAYMLTPETINPATYVIIEIIQFDSLYALTGNPFFAAEGERRRNILKEHYPIMGVSSEREKLIFFSAIGAPHPYLIDIYRPIIRCTRGGRTLELRGKRDGELSERGFSKMAVESLDGLSCSAHAEFRTGVESRLFTVDRPLLVDGDRKPEPLSYVIGDIVLDAASSPDGTVLIDPEVQSARKGEAEYLNEEGRIGISLPVTSIANTDLISIEIEADEPFPIGIALHHGERQIHRYSPPLEAGKKMLLVLSIHGFENSSDFRMMDRMTIYVYTKGFTRKARLKVGNVYVAKNAYEVDQIVREGGLKLVRGAE